MLILPVHAKQNGFAMFPFCSYIALLFFSFPGMSDLSIGGYGGYGAGGRVEFDMFSASPSGIEQTLGVGKKGQAVGKSGLSE